jgi:hypothetical protein
MCAAFVHLLIGFKQLLGGLDDHELLEGLHRLLQECSDDFAGMLEGFGIGR